MKDITPFDQLSVDDQKVAIELTVACSLLITRLPALGNVFFSAVANEFGLQYHLPNRTATSVLRHLGHEFFETEWRFEISKNAEKVIATHFEQANSEKLDGDAPS